MKLALLIVPLLALPSLQDGDEEGGAHVFQLAESCARCHDQSPNAAALTRPDGADGSPHGLWKGTMMAQSFFDPYWRAKMAREIELGEADGTLDRAEVESLCLRCHAPIVRASYLPRSRAISRDLARSRTISRDLARSPACIAGAWA